MFRKIRSNRDPRDTVFSELRRELKPHLSKADNGFKKAVAAHPRTIFGLMVAFIAFSAVLSFTVFRSKPAPSKQPVKVLSPIGNGLSKVMDATAALREMLQLKKAIDSLSGKKQLTAGDSATLERALDRFQQLNKKFNQHEH